MNSAWILRIKRKDEPGIIFRITGILSGLGANIIENEEFVDKEKSLFFMRTEFEWNGEKTELEMHLSGFLYPDSEWTVDRRRTRKIWVLATKEHHCLSEILVRTYHREWNAEVIGVISNHEVLRDFTEKLGFRYFYADHSGKDRKDHEKEIENILLSSEDFDFIVLAKYMRILSPEFSERYSGKTLNIHHSFLPAFIGARPYRQAFERGVKIIGATAHFVTPDLDQGPIISQSVVPVDHSFTEEDLIRTGRDIEVQVLVSAMKLIFEERVFIDGNKTVILK